MGAEEFALITELLGRRLVAKRDFRTLADADALQARLRGMDVELDDTRRVWYKVRTGGPPV